MKLKFLPVAASFVALAAALAAPAVAALDLQLSDATLPNKLSFSGTTAGSTNWPGGSPAAPGNVYRVATSGFIIRGAASANNATVAFQGDSLTLLDNTTFQMRGGFTGVTFDVKKLIVGDGTNASTATAIVAAAGATYTLAASTNIEILTNGTLKLDAGTSGRTMIVSAPITGNGNLTVADIAGGNVIYSNSGMTLGGALTVNGALQVTGGGNRTVGTLARTANGSLALDGATDQVVVTSDYTNTGFGSGNTFNARAGISGSGAIISADMAAGRTNQGLSVNGGTATAGNTALNLNVHTTSSIAANGLTGTNTSDVANGDYRIQNTGTVTKIRGGATNSSATPDGRLSGVGISGGSVETATGYAATGIAAGGTSPNLGVTFTGSGAAGALSGQTVTVSDNFGESQELDITGGAYDLAQANAHAGPITIAAQHVGGSNTATVTVSNVAPTDATYTETLSGGLALTGGATGGSGTFSGITAGDPGTNVSRQVGVNTGTAGHITGTGVLTLKSDAVNSSGLGQTALLDQSFDIAGNVFAYAAATVSTSVTVAAQHVNGSERAAISIANTAAASGGYTETLSATMTTSPAATGSGSVGGLVAGAGPDTTSLMVGVDTTTAGAKSGTATVLLSSDEVMSSGLGSTSLGSSNVGVVGDVYNYAVGDMAKTGGSGTFSGTAQVGFNLDFGTILQNTGTYTANLGALNTAPAAFSDLLSGLFAITAGSGFLLTGFDPFSGLAGQGSHALTVALASADLGSWSETIKFTWNGSNTAIPVTGGGTYVGPTSDIFLTISGTVTDTPEPGILWLMASAGLLGWYSARRKVAKCA
jgi:hypothetical protein